MEKRLVTYDNGWLWDLAYVYCMGKSSLFRKFFGLRESTPRGSTFILSKRAWRELETFIKDNYAD